MPNSRQFLIASSLARLIRKERSGSRITEGYFPNQPSRSSHVLIDGDKGNLVLVTTQPNGAPVEERTEVPRAHAAALLDVAPGKVDYVRSRLFAGGREICVDRFVTPGALDLILVEFENEDEAKDFHPPVWFGPEVTNEAAYQNRSIAFGAIPQIPEIALSNIALESLLDALEDRFRAPRAQAPRPMGAAAEPVAQMPRLTGSLGKAAPAPAPEGQSPAAPEQQAARAPSGAERSGLDLSVEDEVIRELARSLRPQRR
jgi:CYTH domain-containing protein